MSDFFKNMQFPIVKNVNATTIVDSIPSIVPTVDKNIVMIGNKSIDRRTGKVLMTYSSGESKHEFLSTIHNFIKGFGIVNEQGEIVFYNEHKEEYERIVAIRKSRLTEILLEEDIRFWKVRQNECQEIINHPDFEKLLTKEAQENIKADFITLTKNVVEAQNKKIEHDTKNSENTKE